MICSEPELSAHDLQLAAVYISASRQAVNAQPPFLQAEQRGWIKGRDDCWKSVDPHSCVLKEYQLRIAELQARFKLVPGKGPVHYVCEGNPAHEAVVTFFQTVPPTLVAELGDSVSMMYLQRSGSGAMYRGRNETFWEHRGEATIKWGYGSPEMHCKKAP